MKKLKEARAALAGFEADFGTDASLQSLEKGLYVLHEVASANTSDTEMVRNIGRTYFRKACDLISDGLSSKSETEFTLEYYFRVMWAFEDYEYFFKKLKRRSYLQLFHREHQGYTRDEKIQIFKDWMRESDSGGDKKEETRKR